MIIIHDNRSQSARTVFFGARTAEIFFLATWLTTGHQYCQSHNIYTHNNIMQTRVCICMSVCVCVYLCLQTFALMGHICIYYFFPSSFSTWHISVYFMRKRSPVIHTACTNPMIIIIIYLQKKFNTTITVTIYLLAHMGRGYSTIASTRGKEFRLCSIPTCWT